MAHVSVHMVQSVYFFAKNTVYFQFEYFYCELTIRIYLKNPDFTKNCREKNRQIQIL